MRNETSKNRFEIKTSGEKRLYATLEKIELRPEQVGGPKPCKEKEDEEEDKKI